MPRRPAKEIVTEAAHQYRRFTVRALLEDTGVALRTIAPLMNFLVATGELGEEIVANGCTEYFWKDTTDVPAT